MKKPAPATMSIYRVTNRGSGIVKLVPDNSPFNACERAGWDMSACHVIRVEPSWEHLEGQSAAFMVAVPCRVCHAQYASCDLPGGTECHLLADAPDITAWVKKALEAHLCKHVGQPLLKRDYEKRQSFMPTSDAIAHLLSKL